MMSEAERVAEAVAGAEALVITTGAGMGVDSGLPDFRGNEGFWNAYPPFRDLGLNFYEMASPDWFERDPALAWGFYGHRLNLYRRTKPHEGYRILLRWGRSKPEGLFAFTSNVDGAFQKAGYPKERIVEAHGSIHHLQRWDRSDGVIYSADPWKIEVDETTFRAREPLPREQEGGAILRPNILMFGDYRWNAERTMKQETAYRNWLSRLRGRGGSGGFSGAGGEVSVVVVEIGAGTAVPTVRHQSESLASALGALLVRINPREPSVPAGGVGIAANALDALREIDSYLPQDTESI